MRTSDWMASLAGNDRLSSLSIPGSHNSCALFDHDALADTAKCQKLTVSEQLAIGVRFLDIRCRHMENRFRIYHGSVSQRSTFDRVLGECSAFLTAHPAECIILSIKEEGSPVNNTRSFEATFDTYIASSRDEWYFGNNVPTLDEVRGKMVLFRRFGALSALKGVDATQWPENATFWIGNSLRVQDEFAVDNLQEKWNSIESLYREMSSHEGVLFLNFTSGYKAMPIVGIPQITPVSSFVNPRLEAYVRANGATRLGITVMDYVDAGMCSLIIAVN